MLAAFIAASHAEPFAWGKNDCALWCASAVEAVTGYDPAGDLRGTYDSRFGSHRAIMRAGGLVALVAPRMAASGLSEGRGDGVSVIRADGKLACAVIMQGRAVMRMEKGLRIMDDYEVVKGWVW